MYYLARCTEREAGGCKACAVPCLAQAHLAAHAVPPFQKLMMLGSLCSYGES